MFRPVWVEFNRLIEYVREISPVGGRNIQQTRGVNGTLTIATPTVKGEAGNPIQRFLVVADGEGDDHISCRKQDAAGDPIGETIFIAKPRMLRVGVWNGLTIGDWTYSGTKEERLATYSGAAVAGGLQPGDKIKEELFPRYTEGEEIFATEADGETEAFAGGNQLTWIDLNVDARHYRAIRSLVQVCKRINGVDTVWYMVVDGGPVFQRGN